MQNRQLDRASSQLQAVGQYSKFPDISLFLSSLTKRKVDKRLFFIGYFRSAM
jgi:hypothetical protein